MFFYFSQIRTDLKQIYAEIEIGYFFLRVTSCVLRVPSW